MELLVVLVVVVITVWFSARYLFKKRPRSPIVGKAFVIDGDGILVSGQKVRIAGIDAPEWDQVAIDGFGRCLEHGRLVKSKLIQEIGGKTVRVRNEGLDKYGRVLGTVTCGGKDVGEWLVRNGYAIAAYGDRYRSAERDARSTGRGMWRYAKTYDPRDWRKRTWLFKSWLKVRCWFFRGSGGRFSSS